MENEKNRFQFIKYVDMRILGIDPGVAIVGWSVIETESVHQDNVKVLDYGIIETAKTKTLAERLVEIETDLDMLIKQYKPEFAGIESLLFCTNVKTAIAVGEARGVILLVLQKNLIEFAEISPLQMKSMITGYGQADKEQVQNNVMRICGMEIKPTPDDAADAIAIAVCAYGLKKN